MWLCTIFRYRGTFKVSVFSNTTFLSVSMHSRGEKSTETHSEHSLRKVKPHQTSSIYKTYLWLGEAAEKKLEVFFSCPYQMKGALFQPLLSAKINFKAPNKSVFPPPTTETQNWTSLYSFQNWLICLLQTNNTRRPSQTV